MKSFSQWENSGEAAEIKKESSDKHLFTKIKVRGEAGVGSAERANSGKGPEQGGGDQSLLVLV